MPFQIVVVLPRCIYLQIPNGSRIVRDVSIDVASLIYVVCFYFTVVLVKVRLNGMGATFAMSQIIVIY